MINYIHIHKRRGFTLIEMMVAVSIVGILAAVTVPSFIKYVHEAERAEGVTLALSAKRAQETVKNQVLVGRYDSWGQLYTEYFDSGSASIPSLDLRLSNRSKYNLVLGSVCTDINLPADPKTALSDLPGYEYLPAKVNTFGGAVTSSDTNCERDKFIIGAERVLSDGKLDVIAVNEKGNLFLLCDRGDPIAVGSEVYTAYTDGEIDCGGSASSTQQPAPPSEGF